MPATLFRSCLKGEFQVKKSKKRLTAKRRATVTPVLRSSRPRNDESGHSRHSGRNMSFMDARRINDEIR